MTAIQLAAALGRVTDCATLLPYAWGGYCLAAQVGDRVEGYDIATHPDCRGLLIRTFNQFPEQPDAIATVIAGAIASGSILRWGAWRDMTDQVRVCA